MGTCTVTAREIPVGCLQHESGDRFAARSHRQHSLLGLRRFRALVVDDRIGGRLGLALLLLVHLVPEADPIDAQRTPLNARRLGPFGLVPLAERAAERVVGRLFFVRHVFDRDTELAVIVRLQR